MQDYIYSVIAFLAMVIHLIINFDMLPGRKVSNARGAREYRFFLAGVFIYYIVDAGWGVWAGLGWIGVLYVDTMLYYLGNSLGGENGVFTLSVSDTGCGIPDEAKAKLMTPFVQVDTDARIKGTGLGLSICKQLADRMGGELSFVSELGKGSTFTVELHNVKTADLPDPGNGAAAGQESTESMRQDGKTPAEKQKNADNLHILIADDVPLNLAVLKALLVKTGIRDIVTAVDGQDAWEKLQASEKRFDLILTDMWMPKMDGKVLAAKIRADERFAGIPVYVVTADIEEQKVFAEHGFTGVLLKPLTVDKLARLFG